MPDRKSFAETAFGEAVKRALRVDLIVDSVTPSTDTRLISRVVGQSGDQALVLEVPRTCAGRKVFIPQDWLIGMAFELDDLWVQSRTVVLDHQQFPADRGARVDSILVRQPQKMDSCNRRRSLRKRAAPIRIPEALLWIGGPSNAGRDPSTAVKGWLRDWSDRGLGLEFAAKPSLERGTLVCVRLDAFQSPGISLLQGKVMHCTLTSEQSWHVGLGEVEEVAD